MNILLTSVGWDSNAFWALLGAVIGAVFGFLSSLLIDLIARKCSINKFVKRLRLEVNTIHDDVAKVINQQSKIVFTSPIWNFIGQTSILLDMKEELYKKIITIHGALTYFVECENKGNYDPARRQQLLATIEKNKI